MNDCTTIPMKRCTSCGEELPETSQYFPKYKYGRNGLRGLCHDCHRAALGRLPKKPKKSPEQLHLDNERRITKGANQRAQELGLVGDFTVEQRHFALEYFNNSCAICGRQLYDLFGRHHLAFDHWIPLSSSDCPGTTAENLIPVCEGKGGCNNIKNRRMPRPWLIKRYGKRKADEIFARIETYFDAVRSRQDP